jgi:hypothetical protein
VVKLAGTFRVWSLFNVINKLYTNCEIEKICDNDAIFLIRRLKCRIYLQNNDSNVWISSYDFLSRYVHNEIVKYRRVISQWRSLAGFRHSVNSQIRNQYSARNPRQVYQHVFHDTKSEIGCAVPCKTIIGPLFSN